VKLCTWCKETKSLEEFHNDSSTSSGKKAHCKTCTSGRRKALRNPEKAKETYDRWRKNNLKHVAAKAKEWRDNNKDRIQEAYERDKEGINKRKKERRLNDPERFKAYEKAYMKEPKGKEVNRRKASKRRALQRDLPSAPYTRCDIVLRDGGESWMTGNPLDAADTQNVEVDHLIPMACYIPGHPGDVLTNVALCEQPLNASRNNRLTSEALARYTRNVVMDVPDVSGLGDVLEEV
jgi:hypothetical protein